MKLVLGNRQSGKTTELLEICRQDPLALIVCPNKAMCQFVKDQAKRDGIEIQNPITFFEFVHGRFDVRKEYHFLFDELQMSLETLSGSGTVEAAVIDTTFTATEILESRGYANRFF